jgi:hypothetical protein
MAAAAAPLRLCGPRLIDGAWEQHVVLQVDVQMHAAFELIETLVERPNGAARSDPRDVVRTDHARTFTRTPLDHEVLK